MTMRKLVSKAILAGMFKRAVPYVYDALNRTNAS